MQFLITQMFSANFRKSVCLAWTKLLCPASWHAHQAKGGLRRADLSSQRTCMLQTTSQCRPAMNGDPV